MERTEVFLKQTIKNETNKNDEGKWWPQVLAIAITTLGSFSNALVAAWSSPYGLALPKDPRYDVTTEDTAYFIIIQPIGMISTTLFFFLISDRLGRKKSLIALAVPNLLSWALVMCATSKDLFFAARFAAGMGEAVLFSSLPAYVGEITTPTVRGYCGNFPTLILNLGILTITVLGALVKFSETLFDWTFSGSYLDVLTSAYICAPIGIIFFILASLILPESPYQLIKDGKDDEARESLKWLRRKTNIEAEFISMKSDVKRQLSETGTWKDLFSITSNRRALRAGLFLRVAQLMSCSTVFGVYTQVIFHKAGGNLSPQFASIIYVSISGLMVLIGGPIPELLGRKRTFFFSQLFAGTVLLSLGIYFILDQGNYVDLTNFKWFPILGMLLWVTFFTPGMGLVPTLMSGELFSASIKSKGLAILIGTYGVGNFITSFIFTILDANLGLYAPFLIFGISCLGLIFFTMKWVPETKGKTLEEIQQSLKK